jgi:hypothetical protein
MAGKKVTVISFGGEHSALLCSAANDDEDVNH